jgi:hypothetical protein
MNTDSIHDNMAYTMNSVCLYKLSFCNLMPLNLILKNFYLFSDYFVYN